MTIPCWVIMGVTFGPLAYPVSLFAHTAGRVNEILPSI